MSSILSSISNRRFAARAALHAISATNALLNGVVFAFTLEFIANFNSTNDATADPVAVAGVESEMKDEVIIARAALPVAHTVISSAFTDADDDDDDVDDDWRNGVAHFDISDDGNDDATDVATDGAIIIGAGIMEVICCEDTSIGSDAAEIADGAMTACLPLFTVDDNDTSGTGASDGT